MAGTIQNQINKDVQIAGFPYEASSADHNHDNSGRIRNVDLPFDIVGGGAGGRGCS